MRILIAHTSYRQRGGEEVVFEQECQLLQRAGHRLSIYHRSNLAIDTGSIVKSVKLAGNTVWSADTRREVAEVIRQERPEIVHIHNTFPSISPSIYWACQEGGVPVVQTLHNYRLLCPAATFFRDGHTCEDCANHNLWQAVKHKCYRNSRSATAAVSVMLAVHRTHGTWSRKVNSFITLTQFARTRFVHGGLSADKIFVKPNFVYPDPGVSGDRGDYALFVGRLSAEKRVSTVLTAWAHLRRPIPLLVVGDGPARQDLERQASEIGLDTVRFQGFLPREETLPVMQKARFLVFSSESYETFCMSIAESFACGVPVICSRLGAMQEIVQDGRTGLHFTPGDAADLAAKIEWACQHPQEMKTMGQEARREYELKYTAERNYQLLMEIYRSQLK